jgi:hypothetical protein
MLPGVRLEVLKTVKISMFVFIVVTPTVEQNLHTQAYCLDFGVTWFSSVS